MNIQHYFFIVLDVKYSYVILSFPAWASEYIVEKYFWKCIVFVRENIFDKINWWSKYHEKKKELHHCQVVGKIIHLQTGRYRRHSAVSFIVKSKSFGCGCDSVILAWETTYAAHRETTQVRITCRDIPTHFLFFLLNVSIRQCILMLLW